MELVHGEAPAAPTVDLRRLHHLVVVARCGTLTAAAAELHLTQQALSASLQQLQRGLGLPLTVRRGRRLELTPAGSHLAAGAVPILEATAGLVGQARRLTEGRVAAFVVGYSPAISGDEAWQLTAAFRTAFPGRSLTLRPLFPDDLVAGLHDGTLDVALRRGVDTPTDLAAATLGFQELRVAIAATHPLAGRPSVAVAELAPWPIVVWSPPGRSFHTDFLVGACRKAGFEPTLVVNHVQGAPPATAVAGTPAAAFVTDPPGPALGGEVVVLPLDGAPQVPVQALWPLHTRSAERDALLGQA